MKEKVAFAEADFINSQVRFVQKKLAVLEIGQRVARLTEVEPRTK
jgi:hypothetical protein